MRAAVFLAWCWRKASTFGRLLFVAHACLGALIHCLLYRLPYDS